MEGASHQDLTLSCGNPVRVGPSREKLSPLYKPLSTTPCPVAMGTRDGEGHLEADWDSVPNSNHYYYYYWMKRRWLVRGPAMLPRDEGRCPDRKWYSLPQQGPVSPALPPSSPSSLYSTQSSARRPGSVLWGPAQDHKPYKLVSGDPAQSPRPVPHSWIRPWPVPVGSPNPLSAPSLCQAIGPMLPAPPPGPDQQSPATPASPAPSSDSTLF